jgi:hypothetical protein
MKTQRRFEQGERVAFARDFLRNTGQFTGADAPCSWGPFARGTVTTCRGFDGEPIKNPSGEPSLVAVLWDDGQETRALGNNLVAVDRIPLEPA